jgi:hypothetical protein
MTQDHRTFPYELTRLKADFKENQGENADENIELFIIFCMNILTQKHLENQIVIERKLQNIEEQLSNLKDEICGTN